ncbi:synaptotagmin-1 [Hydra vulgaris]|uniref:synaptotagmin-1 n=1 Tax=Hydra vulgaris TaxID=6087 RepID=UPI001F5F8B5E|nr:synaptotagmin-1-like [Hydra vulgaris]
MSTKNLPLVLGAILGVMLAILLGVILLFYKKRKESLQFKIPLERMTRSLKKISSKSSFSSNSSDSLQKQNQKQKISTPVLRDTQFWVPEVYNSIIQPTPTFVRKTSRLQSTLEREIYSKAQDTSYLGAFDNDVLNSDGHLGSISGSMIRSNSTNVKRELARRLESGEGQRGMLNFSLQYKHDKGSLTVYVIKAEGLPIRKTGEYCDPFVELQVAPVYKRRMHSEVHQKTQNPIFNQSFEFEIPPYEIREQSILFTVLDFNQRLAHEAIGSVTFLMNALDQDALFAAKEFGLWKKIDKDVAETPDRIDGKIREFPMEMDLDKTAMLLLLSLNRLKTAERLTVTVNKARNLLLVDKKGKLDHPYVSVTMKHFGKILKKLRTNVVKHETNPVYNKTLVFDCPSHLIEHVSLTIKIRHHGDIGRDRTFAILTIGRNAVGTGAEQWTEMLNSNEPVQRWHRLIPIEPADD